ncbi:MAG: aquaporin family protein [Planctomycetes bacterium]|nr:aquaporin family protein [Planctomycetota bacterium]
MSNSRILIAELAGTWLMITFGCGVVANVLLARSKGFGAGWLAICTGWAFAVTIGVYASNAVSGGHLNPTITLANWVLGKTEASQIPAYVVGQFLGAVLGAVTVWLAYLPHWSVTDDASLKRGVFCTAPAIRSYPSNVLCEAIGTFVLVLGAQLMLTSDNFQKETGFPEGLAPFMVGVLVWAIGLSLGGPTGYAINPFRDLGPRLAHAMLPIAGKGDSDWTYAWVPIVGPILGALLAALVYRQVWQ